MLEQLARQNVQLEGEIAVRRQAEQALHRAHDDLERLVAERTSAIGASERVSPPLETYLAEAQRLSLTGSFGWNVSSGEIYWSQETFRIFEYDPATKLTLELVLQRTHPEDRALARQVIDRASQERKELDFERRLLMPDGSVKYVRVVGHPSTNESGNVEFVGAVTDITERKRAEQRLRAQYTVTQLLAEATTIEEVTPKILQTVCEFLLWDLGALWSLDRQASVLRCVEVWHKESVKVPQFEAVRCEITFMPGIGLPGRVWSRHEPAYISDVVHDTNFPRASIAAREGLHAAFAFPILLGGDVLGVMEFFSREIRQPEQELLNMMATLGSQIGQFIERKRAEDGLRHAQMELAHVTRVATLGEMTASIAHEINQPLGALVNNAGACLGWLDAANLEEARNSVALVMDDAQRASEIITRIRALAKKLHRRKIGSTSTKSIREVIALAQSEVQRNHIALETQLSDDVPLVFADRIQLQQVMLNLMMNAIEAMTQVTGPRELLISSGADDSKGVVVVVRDSGAGLDSKSLERLFEPFYTTKPQGHGNGTGDLPLDHAGPRRPALGDQQSRSRRVVSFHPANGRGTGMSEPDAMVFVVDDDAQTRDALKNLMRSVGLHAEVFASAQDFLRSKRPDVPACLVLDVRLRGLSGLDLQKRMAEAKIEVPIIFITGYGDIPMTVQAMKAGAVEFLTKPFRNQELLDAIQQALERDRTHSRTAGQKRRTLRSV